MSEETVLVLSGVGVPPYSARGLAQALEPIEGAAQLRRDINGQLDDLSSEQFRKYRSTISCNDQDPPSVDGIWPGQVVTVDCVAELAYPISGSAQREQVSGSERVDGDFVFYRPRLEMMVTLFNLSRDEYGAAVNWTLQLEEV